MRHDGQVRVWWGRTPIDLFFDKHDCHRQARGHVRTVPFGDAPIPVLACHDLAVLKTMHGRAKDWGYIETMAAQLDPGYVTDWARRLLGDDSPHVARLLELLEAR